MWIFELDRYQYPSTFDFKFVLDRAHFMTGPNRVASSSTPEQSFGDGDGDVPRPPSAFVHGSRQPGQRRESLEQMTVRSCGREDEDFDVILVGSGMAGGARRGRPLGQGQATLILRRGGLRGPVHMIELPRSEEASWCGTSSDRSSTSGTRNSPPASTSTWEAAARTGRASFPHAELGVP